MVSWIHCLYNDIFIGPLTEEEASQVRLLYKQHGNPFKESNLFLYTPDAIVCSFDDFMLQVKSKNFTGQRGDNAK